jgi:hypothetical protein
VVVAGHGTYFAMLGRLVGVSMRDLLSDPGSVSWRSEEVDSMTYDFANSICEWSLTWC